MKFFLALVSVAGVSAFAPSSPSAFTASKVAAASATPTQLFGEYGASSTSFYTTTEKQDSYASLDDVLSAKCAD